MGRNPITPGQVFRAPPKRRVDPEQVRIDAVAEWREAVYKACEDLLRTHTVSVEEVEEMLVGEAPDFALGTGR